MGFVMVHSIARLRWLIAVNLQTRR